MKYISEAEYEKEMKRISRMNASRERYEALKNERDKWKKKGKKRITTSKLVLWTMVIFCGAVAVWFMYESHRICDLSQAYALLGIVASLVPVVWKYYSKSEAENTSGGIVYDSAMRDNEDDDIGVG